MVTFSSGIDELSSVHSFSGQEVSGLESVFIRVSENNLSKRCTTAWVVDDFSDDSLDVTRRS